MKKSYETPQMQVIEVQHTDIIATSTMSTNEEYETGSTTGWY